MPSSTLPDSVSPRGRPWLAVVLAAWFAAALAAGLAGAFAGGPRRPPAALGAAALLPILAFLAALAASPAVRRFVRSLDLRILTLAQSFRVLGLVFLALWAAGRLPAGFALPAGIGDFLVGVTAPLVARSVVPRLPARLALYVAWTAFGMLDLLVAVTSGILHSGTSIGILTGRISTALMGTVPLSLIPTFLVPLAMILHVAAAYRALAGSAPYARAPSARMAPT
jgi:hypothetical protein